mmetsp:Transcript_72485/g.234270  ORF Transcript_72485/g.234270 Transcript_72485/m.234270 type:complete len:93 (+) Transcript_72485:398-676(+)
MSCSMKLLLGLVVLMFLFGPGPRIQVLWKCADVLVHPRLLAQLFRICLVWIPPLLALISIPASSFLVVANESAPCSMILSRRRNSRWRLQAR